MGKYYSSTSLKAFHVKTERFGRYLVNIRKYSLTKTAVKLRNIFLNYSILEKI